MAKSQVRDLLAMPHRAIVARLQSFRVNMDRLPAARDKALSTNGRRLGAKVKMLSGRPSTGRSHRGNCTIRRPARLIGGIEERVVRGMIGWQGATTDLTGLLHPQGRLNGRRLSLRRN